MHLGESKGQQLDMHYGGVNFLNGIVSRVSSLLETLILLEPLIPLEGLLELKIGLYQYQIF